MSEEFKDPLNEEEEEESGFQFLDYIIILLKYKKLIISITLPIAIIALILTFYTRSYYKAHTSIFIQSQKNATLSQQIMNQFGLSAGGSNRNNVFSDRKLLAEIISSRTFTNQVIDRLKFGGAPEAEITDKIRTLFQNKIRVTPNPFKRSGLHSDKLDSPLMKIIVTDANPQRAAEIANIMVEELVAYINDTVLSQILKKRHYVEKQLIKASNALIQSEEDIKKFQEKTGVFTLEGETHLPPNKFAPALEMEYKRLYRIYKYSNAFYLAVLKQFESVKLEEAKDTNIFLVIDKAIPPNNLTIVRVLGRIKALAVTLFAFVFSFVLAIAMDFHKKNTISKEHSEKIKDIKRLLTFRRIND